MSSRTIFPSQSFSNFYYDTSNFVKSIKTGDDGLRPHQKIMKHFFSLHIPYRGILLFHNTGTGKTRILEEIVNNFIDKYKIVIFHPASLRETFINTFRDKRISFYSYNSIDKFFKDRVSDDDNTNPPLIVFDEIHNLISPISFSWKKSKQYNTRKGGRIPKNSSRKSTGENDTGHHKQKLYDFLMNNGTYKIIASSATPVRNYSSEFFLLLNLLRGPIRMYSMDVHEYDTTLDDKSKERILYKIEKKGKVYFEICPDHYTIKKKGSFLQLEYAEGETNRLFEKIPFESKKLFDESFMKYFEGKIDGVYKDMLEYISLRCTGLVSYYRGDGTNFPKVTYIRRNHHTEDYRTLFDTQVFQKIYYGKVAIYCYSRGEGIDKICTFLEANGFSCSENDTEIPSNRYIKITGDEKEKQILIDRFNDEKNKDGSYIKYILFNTGTEGLEFLSVRSLHILHPEETPTALIQIIGRVIRYNSHRQLNETDRSVEIHYYINHKKKEIAHHHTTWNKLKWMYYLYDILKRCSVDCTQDCYKPLNVPKTHLLYDVTTDFNEDYAFHHSKYQERDDDPELITIKQQLFDPDKFWLYKVDTTTYRLFDSLKNMYSENLKEILPRSKPTIANTHQVYVGEDKNPNWEEWLDLKSRDNKPIRLYYDNQNIFKIQRTRDISGHVLREKISKLNSNDDVTEQVTYEYSPNHKCFMICYKNKYFSGAIDLFEQL